MVALPYVYFLLYPFVSISAVLMIVGGVLVWTRKAILGASLVLAGGLLGGFLGLPSLLWTLLAAAFGNEVYRLPLLPLGLVLPLTSVVLGLLSQ